MCGKNVTDCASRHTQLGSPPRVREKRPNIVSNFTLLGITPACAGKTCAEHLDHARLQDHPRVCGKNTFHQTVHLIHSGSPPRVREKRLAWLENVLNAGITPACAGKTTGNEDAEPTNGDHPRVCGKNFKALINAGSFPGSPPRVREKH